MLSKCTVTHSECWNSSRTITDLVQSTVIILKESMKNKLKVQKALIWSALIWSHPIHVFIYHCLALNSSKTGLSHKYLCFYWLQLSKRSMGVINTLQQLTSNILLQPLTPLMDDWLCKAWEPRGCEWHGSILSVRYRQTIAPQILWLMLIFWGYTNHRGEDQGTLVFL